MLVQGRISRRPKEERVGWLDQHLRQRLAQKIQTEETQWWISISAVSRLKALLNTLHLKSMSLVICDICRITLTWELHHIGSQPLLARLFSSPTELGSATAERLRVARIAAKMVTRMVAEVRSIVRWKIVLVKCGKMPATACQMAFSRAMIVWICV